MERVDLPLAREGAGPQLDCARSLGEKQLERFSASECRVETASKVKLIYAI